MNNTKKSFLDMTFKEVGEGILDKLIELVVTAEKPEKIERLTFSGLVSRATLLAEKYQNAVNCKCIISRNSKARAFDVGVWAIDAEGKFVSDEYGLAQITMETMGLDDKLNDMLRGGVCANFILELQ